MLNSWELLCMVIMKHLSTLPAAACSFYEVIDQTGIRNDDARLSLIMLVKIVEYCQFSKLN